MQENTNTHEKMAKLCSKKRKDRAGGQFFTVYRHKKPAEYGVWARSKDELIKYYNKIRLPFTRIDIQV